MVLLKTKSDQYIYMKTHQIASIISKISQRACPEPPSICAADIIISI